MNVPNKCLPTFWVKTTISAGNKSSIQFFLISICHACISTALMPHLILPWRLACFLFYKKHRTVQKCWNVFGLKCDATQARIFLKKIKSFPSYSSFRSQFWINLVCFSFYYWDIQLFLLLMSIKMNLIREVCDNSLNPSSLYCVSRKWDFELNNFVLIYFTRSFSILVITELNAWFIM